MCRVSALLLKPWLSFFKQCCLMWAALANLLQLILLAGNPTQVFKFSLIVMERNDHNLKEKVMPRFCALFPLAHGIHCQHSAQNKMLQLSQGLGEEHLVAAESWQGLFCCRWEKGDALKYKSTWPSHVVLNLLVSWQARVPTNEYLKKTPSFFCIQ